MQSALDIVEELARLNEATRVRRGTMRVGRFAGVEPEALAFAFEAVTCERPPQVLLRGCLGTVRVVDVPSGAPLPRIC
jgi:hypothetical protein